MKQQVQQPLICSMSSDVWVETAQQRDEVLPCLSLVQIMGCMKRGSKESREQSTLALIPEASQQILILNHGN